MINKLTVNEWKLAWAVATIAIVFVLAVLVVVLTFYTEEWIPGITVSTGMLLYALLYKAAIRNLETLENSDH